MEMSMTNKIMIILSTSIILNAFMAGVIVARPSMHDRPPFMMGGDPRMMRELDAVSEEYRGKVQEIMKTHHQAARETMNKIQGEFGDIKEILTAPKFNEVKFSELRKALDANDIKMKENMSDMIMSIAKTLPDDQRIKFFESMMDDMRPPMGGRGPDFHHGENPMENREMPK